MATKNNFSKAVLDLMGRPGNERTTAVRTSEAGAKPGLDHDKKADLNSSGETGTDADRETGRDAEEEKEAKVDNERSRIPYPAQSAAAGTVSLIQEDVPATVISKSMVIVGEVTSGGDIDIYGDVKGSVKTDGDIKATGKIVGDMEGNSFLLNGCTVQGNIKARGTVSIGLNTVVAGDITADSIKLNGKVKGNLFISRMSEFEEYALLVGDVRSQTISMSQGAKLHGNISVALDSSLSEKEFDSIFGV